MSLSAPQYEPAREPIIPSGERQSPCTMPRAGQLLVGARPGQGSQPSVHVLGSMGCASRRRKSEITPTNASIVAGYLDHPRPLLPGCSVDDSSWHHPHFRILHARGLTSAQRLALSRFTTPLGYWPDAALGAVQTCSSLCTTSSRPGIRSDGITVD